MNVLLAKCLEGAAVEAVAWRYEDCGIEAVASKKGESFPNPLPLRRMRHSGELSMTMEGKETRRWA